MKAPVSILCISDLHLRSVESVPIKKLGECLLNYANNNPNGQAICWIPDYIVIAGDIVDKGKHDYSLAKKHIKKLLDLFNIDSSRVIMVPGNHDKNNIEENLRGYKKECELFDDFQNNVIINRQRFWDDYNKKFGDYLSFCKDISKGTNIRNEYSNIKDLFPDSCNIDDLCFLSGVRYFEEDKLCFVYVNTEWLYVNPKNLLGKTNKSCWDYLSIKERCKLCAPIVYDAANLIRTKYADATVITVMHRFFNDLYIMEYNNTDHAKMDPVHLIEEISDIILTGHEHRVSIAPPSFITNRYQHISLGATGIDSVSKPVQARTACVVNINPAQKALKMLNAVYNDSDRIWTFIEDEHKYPLRHYNVKKEKEKDGGRIPRIKAKIVDKTVIDDAIKKYFSIKPEDKNLISFHSIRYDEDSIKNELDKVFKRRRNTQKLLFVVVYDIVFEDSDNREESRIVEEYRETHCSDMIDNVIVKEVDVVIPTPINIED